MARIKKVKVAEEVPEEVELVETASVPEKKQIAELTQEFTHADLNILRNKINELIKEYNA